MNNRYLTPLARMAGHRGVPASAGALALAMALALSTPGVSAQGLETRYLYVKSECRHPIRVLVHHKDSDSPHHTHAWFRLDPAEGNRLRDNNVTLRQVVGEDLYLFAETFGTSPGMQWAGTDAATTFTGVYYRLLKTRMFVNQSGDLQVSLRCE